MTEDTASIILPACYLKPIESSISHGGCTIVCLLGFAALALPIKDGSSFLTSARTASGPFCLSVKDFSFSGEFLDCDLSFDMT